MSTFTEEQSPIHHQNDICPHLPATSVSYISATPTQQ